MSAAVVNCNFLEAEMHVRSSDNDPNLTLSFFANGEFRQMSRPKDEDLSKTMRRFAMNCIPKAVKSKNGNKGKMTADSKIGQQSQQQSASNDVRIQCNGKDVDMSGLKNFQIESGMVIIVGVQCFNVRLNVPTVTALTTFPKCELYVGCPIVPQVEVEFANGYECMWCCENSPKSREYEVASRSKVFQPNVSSVGCQVKLFCTAFRASSDTSVERVVGRATTFYISGVIKERPLMFNRMILERREFNELRKNVATCDGFSLDMFVNGTSTNAAAFHQQREQEQEQAAVETLPSVSTASSSLSSNRGLRIVTYNILAEPFATSEHSLNVIYNYVEDKAVLQTEYRIQRILAELLAYQADVICLQECDRKMFQLYLLPLLGLVGYSGHYTNKASSVLEGCATFIHTHSLRVLQNVDLPLKNVLRLDQATAAAAGGPGASAHLVELFQLRPDLVSVLEERLGTVAQITICEDRRGMHYAPRKNRDVELSTPAAASATTGKDSDADTETGTEPDLDGGCIIILVNTHLFYHPDASFIRLQQVHAITAVVEQLLSGVRRHGWDYVVQVDGAEAMESAHWEQERRRELLLFDPCSPEHSSSRRRLRRQSQCIVSSTISASDSSNTENSSMSQDGSDYYSLKELRGGCSDVDASARAIIMGDLNSSPTSPATEFLASGKVSAATLNASWRDLDQFRWGPRPGAAAATVAASIQKLSEEMDTLQVTTVSEERERGGHDGYPGDMAALQSSLTHTLNLCCTSQSPVCTTGIDAAEHNLTNYTDSFKAQLDYIYVQGDGFGVRRAARLPAEQVLGEFRGLPSAVFPSDHIAVAVDLDLL